MELESAVCYRAVQARDVRWDGRFFTCVKSTGIYCRPICPARAPKLENCVFVATAAAAQEAGFRACLRCRPESSPDLDAWRGTSATVSRALRLIEGGALDEGDVSELAERLEIGERQLRRLFRQHVGAAPVTVAQTRRVLLAKQLIHQTGLSMLDVALASGFGSVRRFNETFQHLYQRPPSALKRGEPSAELALLLPYRPPYDWESMLAFLAGRAIPGLETVTPDSYARAIQFGASTGSIRVSHEPKQSALKLAVRFPELSVLPVILARTRRMFDLSTDPAPIAAVLAQDALLAPLLAARPGLRLPGGWDGFETGVRAILGQQISVKAAVQLAGQIVAQLGEGAFARPERFQELELRIPRARLAALKGMAAAAVADPHLFDPRRDLAEAVAHLCKLPGVGEWTAQYIAMRALGESDAFLAGDAALLKVLSKSELVARAENWRPWRAYAVMHLWRQAALA